MTRESKGAGNARSNGRPPATTASIAHIRPAVGRARVLSILIILGLVMAGLTYRIVDVQATPDPRVLEEVSIPLGEIIVPAARGKVLDRRGRTIALSLPAATIVADPRLVVNPAGTAQALSEVLGIPAHDLEPSLRGDAAFRYVVRQVDAELGDEIDELALEGIRVISEPRREHPNGDCSALAAVGRVNIDHVGMSGIEESLDERLSGVAGRIRKEMGVDGTTIPGGAQEVIAPTVGTDVTVTLDRNIQYQAEWLLLDVVAQAGASSGVALVSLPASGEILAMANVARGENGIVACTRQNLAATWSYEPGSVFKPVTAAAAIENGLLGEHTLVDVPAHLTIWDHRFEDTPSHGNVSWSPTEIVTRSSNIGTIRMAQIVGTIRLDEMVQSFGFGQLTPLSFKGESKGIVLPRSKWNGLSLPNMAIGQGLAVTPLQMLQAYNAIANNGVMMPLRLVADSGEVDEDDNAEMPQPRRVLSSTTSAALLRILEAVVLEGTGRRAAMEGFTMAGKTGTAWQPCDKGYACVNERDELIGRHHTATFAGIVSNSQGPALVVLVVIDEPKGDRISGGRLSAPAVREIATYSLRQLRVPAEEDAQPGDRRRAAPAPEPEPLVQPDDAAEAAEGG